MKIFEIVTEDANAFKKGAKDANTLAKHATAMHSKADAAMANSPVAKTQQYKDYKKTSQQKKIDAMKKGMPYGRQDVGEEGLLQRGLKAIGLDNIGNMAGKTQASEADVNRKALELYNQGMPPQQAIQALQQEFGVVPHIARQAYEMARAGLIDESSSGKGEAMLAKADMLLQGTGFARKGFKIVKAAQQGMVRGSITDEALAMVKNLIAKAQAMGATDSPALDPKPTVNPADIDDKEFESMYETVAGDIGSVATPLAPMQRRNMYNADGTMKNGADFGNLLGGKKKSTKTKKK